MHEIPITVYTPVYNGSRYISETIESVQRQGFSNFEYLIINDGSTDDTEEIVTQYAKKDSRIRVISQTNKGVSTASNLAISMARGKYCFRIDADDLCLPGRFAVQYEYMEKNPHVTVCGGLLLLFGGTNSIVSTQAESDSEIRVFFLSNPALANSASCIKTSFMKDNNIWFDTDISFGEDFDLWSRMSFLDNCCFYNIQQPLSAYRIHPLSATNRIEDTKKTDFLNKIRLRHIQLLDPFPLSSEIEIHSMLMDVKHDLSFEDLVRAEAWASKLIIRNELVGVYDQKTLLNILEKKLYQVGSASSVSGMKLFKWYVNCKRICFTNNFFRFIYVSIKKFFKIKLHKLKLLVK
jgi:glycosyltransferase involved in cell wall biosynthesis